MAAVGAIGELSWLCTILFLFLTVVLMLACVCFKEHEKPHDYGTAGRLSITRDSPIVQLRPRNGGPFPSNSKQNECKLEDSNLKRNSWTVKDRALPEIPSSTPTSIANERSSLKDNGSISQVTTSENHFKVKSHIKYTAPRPPVGDTSKIFPLDGSSLLAATEGPSNVTVTITVNDKTHMVGSTIASSEMGVKPRSIPEAVPGTSNNIVLLKKVEKVENMGSSEMPTYSDTYRATHLVEDGAQSSQTPISSKSPVCIQIGNLSPGSEENNLSSPSASLAVAGAVPSSDIPYMTPPLLHNPSLSSAIDTNQESNGHNEVPYTVISVREPLARVREITLKKQRASMPQSSEESEDHYAMVPEEEQMYAEIGSGHDSGSSSITYAHIEPRELPPVPPTVESLKSVAHAHSRQASTVSTSSFGSCFSSSGEPASSPILGCMSTSLHSSSEKNNKQRKTIHVAEGASLVSTVEKRKKVEDLYAKVRKQRVDLTINTSGCEGYSTYQGIHGEDIDTVTPPPSPWASTTPPAPPPITGRLQASSLNVLLSGGSHHIRRHSADPNLSECVIEQKSLSGSSHNSFVATKDLEEPGYEQIYNEENNSSDSCYERIKDAKNLKDNLDLRFSGATCSGINQNESSFPGYATVKDQSVDEDSLDPGYECVANTGCENDPGYEPVRISVNFEDDPSYEYSVLKIDDIKEPGYEVVKKLSRTESDAADPGYEKIRKILRTESDATDPGYERVRNDDDDVVDPGYETVQRSDSDTEPGYEIVRHRKNSCSSNIPESSTVQDQNSNNMFLFVTESSEMFDPEYKQPSVSHDEVSIGTNECTATFL